MQKWTACASITLPAREASCRSKAGLSRWCLIAGIMTGAAVLTRTAMRSTAAPLEYVLMDTAALRTEEPCFLFYIPSRAENSVKRETELDKMRKQSRAQVALVALALFLFGVGGL